jgi:hypothetical protein
MTIHAWEHNDPLDPAHVAHYPPAHPRCGTAFLLEVVAISIVLFALLGTPDLWLRILSRVLLIPVIAGIAYELLRLGGKYPNSPLPAGRAQGCCCRRDRLPDTTQWRSRCLHERTAAARGRKNAAPEPHHCAVGEVAGSFLSAGFGV